MRIGQRQQGKHLLKTSPYPHFASACAVGMCMLKGIYGGVFLFCLVPYHAVAADAATLPSSLKLTRADFKLEKASLKAISVADWVLNSGDNQSMPFVIIDKADAKIFVFNVDGRLRGASRALLGMAVGDDTVPGIGERAISKIRPEERTTPAGRFVAALGRDLHGDEILWVDYDAAIAIHRVVTSHLKEHRLQRLATATSFDKRISYGCINVPAIFYDSVVHPIFTGTDGVVYVLPEIKSIGEVFASFEIDEQKRMLLKKNTRNVKPELKSDLSTYGTYMDLDEIE